MAQERVRWLPLCTLGGTMVVIDQAVKAWVLVHLNPVFPRPVIEGVLSLVLVKNTGIAFGLLGGTPAVWKTVLLLLLALVILALLLWFYVAEAGRSRMMQLAVALVAGGAVGNMIDRLRFGAVIDFIDVSWRYYHWPAFNVADAGISIGVALLLGLTVFGPRG